MRIKKNNSIKLGIIGKVKVGKLVEKGNKTFPVSLGHFRATSNVAQYEQMFNNLYQESSLLPIMFGENDDEFNINHVYEIRDSTGRVYSYGNGEDYFVSVKEGFKMFEKSCILSKYGTIEAFLNKSTSYLSTSRYKAQWMEVLTIRFVIPNMPILGAWELRTMASKSSIDQIIGSYDLAKNISGGEIKSVPFFLRVQKVKSNRVLDQNRVYPVISLDQVITNQVRESEYLNNGIKLIE